MVAAANHPQLQICTAYGCLSLECFCSKTLFIKCDLIHFILVIRLFGGGSSVDLHKIE